MSASTFIIPMEPRGKGRPRATSIGGRARQYTPKSTRRWESEFAARAERYMPADPLCGPVALMVVFVFKRPQRLNRKKDHEGLIPHDRKPDLDNCLKSTIDGLGAWFEHGDQQIHQIHAMKYYAERAARPRIEITIKEMRDV